MKQFFIDTWKVLLAIFIVTSSLLYVLLFDGSPIPFFISFVTSLIIILIKSVKDLINIKRLFMELKRLGFDKQSELYKITIDHIKGAVLCFVLIGAWTVYIIVIIWVNI